LLVSKAHQSLRQIATQLQANYPHNFFYHQPGRYCMYFVEVPFMHDIQERFEAGLSVDDNTAELVWVHISELESLHKYNHANIQPDRLFTNYVIELMTGMSPYATYSLHKCNP